MRQFSGQFLLFVFILLSMQSNLKQINRACVFAYFSGSKKDHMQQNCSPECHGVLFVCFPPFKVRGKPSWICQSLHSKANVHPGKWNSAGEHSQALEGNCLWCLIVSTVPGTVEPGPTFPNNSQAQANSWHGLGPLSTGGLCAGQGGERRSVIWMHYFHLHWPQHQGMVPTMFNLQV